MKLFDRFTKPKTHFTEEILLKLLEETEYNIELLKAKHGTLTFTKPFKVDYFLSTYNQWSLVNKSDDIKKETDNFGTDQNVSEWVISTYEAMRVINPIIETLNRLGYDKFVHESPIEFNVWQQLSSPIESQLPMVRWLLRYKLSQINSTKYPITEPTPGGIPLDINRLVKVYKLQPILAEDGLDFVDGIMKRAQSIESCKLYDKVGFDMVVDYFNEAKRCFVTGNDRASAIMSIASLEGCLYLHYQRTYSKEFKNVKNTKTGKPYRSVFEFYLDQNLIPVPYKHLVEQHKKMRNDIAHPDKPSTTFTEESARRNLESVKDVINSILINCV